MQRRDYGTLCFGHIDKALCFLCLILNHHFIKEDDKEEDDKEVIWL